MAHPSFVYAGYGAAPMLPHASFSITPIQLQPAALPSAPPLTSGPPLPPAPVANGMASDGSDDESSDASPKAAAPAPATESFSLTHGLHTPDQVQRQKEVHAQSLEEQLQKGVEILGKNHKDQLDRLHADANEKKHQFNLLQDQHVKHGEMVLSQQYNQQLMMLQQAAQKQRADLEQQAAHLTLEWQQMKTQEEFMKEQHGMQERYQQAQKELQEEMAKVGQGDAAQTVLALEAQAKAQLAAVAAASAAPVPIVTNTMAYVPPAPPVYVQPSLPPTLLSFAVSVPGSLPYVPPAPSVGSRPGSFVPPVPGAATPSAPILINSRPGSFVPLPTSRPGSFVPLPTSRPGSYVPPPLPATASSNAIQIVTPAASLSQQPRVLSYHAGPPRSSPGTPAGSYVPPVPAPRAPSYNDGQPVKVEYKASERNVIGSQRYQLNPGVRPLDTTYAKAKAVVATYTLPSKPAS